MNMSKNNQARSEPLHYGSFRSIEHVDNKSPNGRFLLSHEGQVVINSQLTCAFSHREIKKKKKKKKREGKRESSFLNSLESWRKSWVIRSSARQLAHPLARPLSRSLIHSQPSSFPLLPSPYTFHLTRLLRPA